MKITYDTYTDILTIILKDAAIAESDEEKPGMILDYDTDGHMVSIEILDASRRVTQPNQMVYELAGSAV
ncbi:MAG: DUF2283 domain-containing protein [Chloroflexi bacterium]|nr:DUF2283 domain-containing protein [Chloroflexota bacterium]